MCYLINIIIYIIKVVFPNCVFNNLKSKLTIKIKNQFYIMRYDFG